MFALDTEFDKTNPKRLAESIAVSLDDYNAQVAGLIEVEHDENGHHTNLTAKTITTTGNVALGDSATADAHTINGATTINGVTTINGGATSPAVKITGSGVILVELQAPDGSATQLRFSREGTTPSGSLNWGESSSEILFSLDAATEYNFTDDSGNSILKLKQSPIGLYERDRTTAMGEWIAVTFNAANFTASSGTWTLASGDQIVFRYMLIGKSMWIDFELRTTSTSAGMTTELRIALPASSTVANNGRQFIQVSDNGAAFQVGMAVWAATETYVRCYVNPTGATNWTSGATDTTAVIGTIGPIEVT